MLTKDKIDKIGNLEVKVHKLLPTPNLKCSQELSTYDECTQKETLELLDDFCMLPFVNPLGESIPPCTNFSQGYIAFKLFAEETASKCQLPCSQVEVKIKMNEVMPIFQIMNPDVGDIADPGYQIEIPPTVGISEMVQNYDWVSYVAEIGGWTGLFTGLSVFGIVCMLYDWLSGLSNILGKKVFLLKVLVSVFSLVCLWFVVQSSFTKLIRQPVGTDISIQSEYRDIQVSVCKEKPFDDSILNTNDIDKINTFLSINENLIKDVRDIKIFFKNGTVTKIFSNSWDKHGLKVFSNMKVYHILESKIEYCISLDFEDISRAEVTGRTEVFFYVNYKMQNLFLPGKERITALPSKSIEINKNKKYVTSTYSELQVDYFYKTNSMEVDFDSCAFSAPLSEFDIKYLNGNFTYSKHYLNDLASLKSYLCSKCALPERYIQTESTQYLLTQKIEMVDDPTENLTNIINPGRILPVFLDLPIFVVFNKVILISLAVSQCFLIKQYFR